MEKLDVLSEYVYSMERQATKNDEEDWVDSGEVCHFLRISVRTLQRLRTNRKITHSCMGGKYYYQISQIKKLLQAHIIKSTEECLQDLIEYNNRSRIKE